MTDAVDVAVAVPVAAGLVTLDFVIRLSEYPYVHTEYGDLNCDV